MRFFILIVAALVSLSPWFQEPVDIGKLLHRIDSENLVDREAATRALILLGMPARAKIETASKTGPPERVARLKRILEAIDNQIEALPTVLDTILKEHAGSLHQLVRHAGKKVHVTFLNKPWDEGKRVLAQAGYRLLEQRDAQAGEVHYSEFTYLAKSAAWRSEGGIPFDLRLYVKADAIIAPPAGTRYVVVRAEAQWVGMIGRPQKGIRFPKGTVLQALMENEELNKETVEYPILKEIELRYDLGRQGPWRHATSSAWQFRVIPELASEDGLRESRPFFVADTGLDEPIWDDGSPIPSDWVSRDTLGPLVSHGGSKSELTAGPWALFDRSWRTPWAGSRPLKFRAYSAADLATVPPESESVTIDFLALKEADLDPLAALPKLSSVWVDCQRITVGGLERLAKIKNLSQLDLSPDEPLSDDCLRFLSTMKVSYLHPSYGCDLEDADLEVLARNGGLKSLALSDWNSKFTDSGLELLAKMPALESFELWYGSKVTHEGLAQLARLPKLKSMTIAYVRSFNDEGLKAIAASPGVEYLNLIELNITDAGLKELQSMKPLKYLRVSQCKRVTPAGMKALGALHPSKLEFRRDR